MLPEDLTAHGKLLSITNPADNMDVSRRHRDISEVWEEFMKYIKDTKFHVQEQSRVIRRLKGIHLALVFTWLREDASTKYTKSFTVADFVQLVKYVFPCALQPRMFFYTPQAVSHWIQNNKPTHDRITRLLSIADDMKDRVSTKELIKILRRNPTFATHADSTPLRLEVDRESRKRPAEFMDGLSPGLSPGPAPKRAAGPTCKQVLEGPAAPFMSVMGPVPKLVAPFSKPALVPKLVAPPVPKLVPSYSVSLRYTLAGLHLCVQNNLQRVTFDLECSDNDIRDFLSGDNLIAVHTFMSKLPSESIHISSKRAIFIFPPHVAKLICDKFEAFLVDSIRVDNKMY